MELTARDPKFSVPNIADYAASLAAVPGRLLLRGYVDETEQGTPDELRKLMQERADFVRSKLIEAGVCPEKLVAEGFNVSDSPDGWTGYVTVHGPIRTDAADRANTSK